MFTNRILENVAISRAVAKWRTRVTALAVLLFGCLTFGSSAPAMAGPYRKTYDKKNHLADVPYTSRNREKAGFLGNASGSNGKSRKPRTPLPLWSGERPNFDEDTKAKVFAHPQDGKHKCDMCENNLFRKKDLLREENEPYITIDHKTDYRTHIMNKATPKTYEISEEGHTYIYTGYNKEDAKKWHNDTNNLRPTCSSCNSSKNGRKNLDHLKPEYQLKKNH